MLHVYQTKWVGLIALCRSIKMLCTVHACKQCNSTLYCTCTSLAINSWLVPLVAITSCRYVNNFKLVHDIPYMYMYMYMYIACYRQDCTLYMHVPVHVHQIYSHKCEYWLQDVFIARVKIGFGSPNFQILRHKFYFIFMPALYPIMFKWVVSSLRPYTPGLVTTISGEPLSGFCLCVAQVYTMKCRWNSRFWKKSA